MTIYVHRIGYPIKLDPRSQNPHSIHARITSNTYPFTKSVGSWVLPMVVEEVHRHGLEFRIVIFYDNEESQKTVLLWSNRSHRPMSPQIQRGQAATTIEV